VPRSPPRAEDRYSVALLPVRFDLDQLVVLRRRLRPLAPRPAEGLRFVDHLRLHGRLGAIGLDHHQAGIVQQLLRVEARLFDPRRLLDAPRLFARRLDRRGRLGVLLRRLSLLVAALLRARLELVDATLLLGQR